MAKYLLSYHGGGMPESPEERAKVMAAWGAWIEHVGASLVDAGAPVGESTTIAADGTSTPGGGTNPVSGYSLLDAETLDAAIDLAKGCPILLSGGSIEVGETFEVM
jgi:hypothetical protein